MVLYGMVWYGIVWYGMVWYGIVQYSGSVVSSFISVCLASQPRDKLTNTNQCDELLTRLAFVSNLLSSLLCPSTPPPLLSPLPSSPPSLHSPPLPPPSSLSPPSSTSLCVSLFLS